jgi:serine/threonine protein kinase/tetratricopeptide (TPR) repeat protein
MPTTGQTVLHYEIGAKLGAGGMGEVFRARDTRLGREVALKFISPAFRDDPDRRARLLKEAQAASALRSPAIATTYDIGESGSDLFIIMELVDGEPLSERFKRGPLDVPTVLRLTGQVADALDEAHGLGIIHRDIKSANLLLTQRGRIKILDFGLAKTLETSGLGADEPTLAETQIGTVVGTVSYMSPEQALGKKVDHRSDLFSLGVVMYEGLTGRLPFVGKTLAAVVDQIIRQEPPALARLNYDVPVRLQDIVRKLLSKTTSSRYQGAKELLIDLTTLRRDLELEESQLESSSRSTPTPTVSESSATTVAVLPFANITREPTDDWIGSGIAETVTADLKTIRGLTVLGRERVFDALRDLGSSDSGSLDERVSISVGQQLGATWLISGGYQRLGDVIRITARGVDVASGTVIRTVKIDGQISDIFGLQDKIVYELSQGINLKLNPSEVAAIERQETKSVEAYEMRSRAMMNLMEGSPQALDRAIHLLEKATSEDANYAAAWAALGAAYDFKGQFLSLRDLSLKAVDMERRAIAIDPQLADAHRWLGMSLLSVARYDEAITAIEEALRLEPGDANVYSALGRAYWIGKGDLDAGISHLERAAEINPDLGYAHLQLGLMYAIRGDYAEAERSCQYAIDMQERFVSGREGLQIIGAYTRLGYVHYLRGDYQKALQILEQQVEALSASGHALRERSLIELNYKIGATYLRMGQQEEAERYFSRALKSFDGRVARGADDPFTKYYIAGLYALREDTDHALRYFEQTLEHLPALNRTRASLDPDFASLREDPRMMALLTPTTGKAAAPQSAGGVVS